MFFGIFAVWFNILFGLTGYLSFGHAAFFLLATFFLAMRITNSPFGMMIKGIKSNQNGDGHDFR